MVRVVAVLSKLLRYASWCGGGLTALTAVVVSVDVTLRKTLNMTLGGADELAGFALAISSAWAFGYALLSRAHVRIDLVYGWLPIRLRATLDLVAAAVLTLFAGVLAWHGYGVFADSLRLNSHTMSALATPLAVPQFFWVAGLIVFLLTCLVLLGRALMAFTARDYRSVQEQIGTLTVREYIESDGAPRRDVTEPMP